MTGAQQQPAATLEVTGAVGTVTLNRPEEKNGLSLEVVKALAEVLTHAHYDQRVRCVVLRGAGGIFCAGGNLVRLTEEMKLDPVSRRAKSKERLNYIHQAITTLRNMPKPVIASVAGAAAGGGLGVALACDWIIAGNTAKFGYAYDRIGLSPDAGVSYWLPRILGQRQAMELALFGGTFDAARAMAMGLVNRVVDDSELAAQTREVAERLAAGPTLGYGKTKALFNRSLRSSFEDQVEAEREAVNDCLVSDDFGVAVQAFLDKGKPHYVGH